jgi:hypothetical protein
MLSGNAGRLVAALCLIAQQSRAAGAGVLQKPYNLVNCGGKKAGGESREMAVFPDWRRFSGVKIRLDGARGRLSLFGVCVRIEVKN